MAMAQVMLTMMNKIHFSTVCDTLMANLTLSDAPIIEPTANTKPGIQLTWPMNTKTAKAKPLNTAVATVFSAFARTRSYLKPPARAANKINPTPA